MKANRAYDLTVTRSGVAPAWLADPDRIDHIEVVEIDSGEVVLFWDCTPARASKLARRLRESMAAMEADEFLAAWQDVEG